MLLSANNGPVVGETKGEGIRYTTSMAQFILLLVIVGLGVGLLSTHPQNEAATSTVPLAASSPSSHATTFPEATFGGVSLRLELATTSEAQELGLGRRVSIDRDYGMLFVFQKADRYGFWMKDTRIPLDIFWLDDKGHVIWIEQEVSPSTYPHVFYPPAPVHYVLETASGFAREHHIATTTLLKLINFPSVLK